MKRTCDIVYSPSDPDVCLLDLFQPDEANGCCIFFVHGGGWSGGSKESWHAVMEHFVDLGYVCTSATYHRAPGWHFPKQIEDVRTAMGFVKSRAGEWGFEPGRIAAFGSSAGGHLVAMLATIRPQDALGATPELQIRETVPAAAVCLCAVLTCHHDERTHENVTPMVERFIGATEDERADLYAQASPVDRVTGGEPPFLMIVGDADRTTPVALHEEMQRELAAQHVRAELVVLPGVGHGYGYGVETEAQQQMLGHVGRFLRGTICP